MPSADQQPNPTLNALDADHKEHHDYYDHYTTTTHAVEHIHEDSEHYTPNADGATEFFIEDAKYNLDEDDEAPQDHEYSHIALPQLHNGQTIA